MARLLTILLLCVTTQATDIPSTNRTTWEGAVGVTGGIPARTTIFTNFTSSATPAQINAAIAACPSNQVVKLGSGTFTVDSTISHSAAWGVTLRGNGPTNTILALSGTASPGIYFNGSSGSSYFGGGNVTPTMVSGYTQGSTSVVVSSSTGIVPATWGATYVRFYEGTNTDIPVVSPGLEGGPGTNCVVQWVKVTSKSGTTIGFEPPMFWTYQSDYGPACRFPSPGSFDGGNFIRMCGVEDLCVSNTLHSAGSGQQNILFLNAADCWVKNVVVTQPVGKGIEIWDTYRCEVRESVIRDAVAPLTSSQGYGINIGTPGGGNLPPEGSTGLLVENNVFIALRSPILLGYGASGNAIAYNWFTNTVNETPTLAGLSISVHSAHPMMNLIEGNVGTEMDADIFHGSGSHQTVFRNLLLGRDNLVSVSSVYSIALHSYQHWYNLVGNILGYSGIVTQFQAMTSPTGSAVYEELATIDTAQNANRYKAYMLGYIGTGGGSSGPNNITWDTNVWVTVTRNGNYDYVTGTQVWAPGDDHTLRNSYLYGSRPTWLPTGYVWPPIDPATPLANTIPANYWYVNNNGVWDGGGMGPTTSTNAIRTTGHVKHTNHSRHHAQ